MMRPDTIYSAAVRLSHFAAIILVLATGLTGLRLAWLSEGRLSSTMAGVVDLLVPSGTIHQWHLYFGLTLAAVGLFHLLYSALSGERRRLVGLFYVGPYSLLKKITYLGGFGVGLVAILTGISIHAGLYAGPDGYLFNSVIHSWCARLLLLFAAGHLIEVVINKDTRINAIFLARPFAGSWSPRVALITTIICLVVTGTISVALDSPTTLRCHSRNRGIVIDGRVSDIEWYGVDSIVVQTSGGANFQVGTAAVTIKAFHNLQRVYFLVRWNDATPSFNRHLIKDGDQWCEEVSEYADRFGEAIYSEDQLGLFWFRDPGGCAATCHVGEGDRMGLHYTDNDTIDGWQWMAVSTNPALEADDRWWGLRDNDSTGGRHTDNKAAGGYVSNLNRDWKQPYFLPTHRAVRDWIWLGSSGYEAYADSLDIFVSGDRVPAVLVAPTTGGRGDVTARGIWHNGVWTVEISRLLAAESPHDISLRGELFLGVALFDNAQSHHSYHLRPIKVVVE
ncbi:MAG: hypothetical protein KOO62_10380 [candidate division Zixibacteria bacterium]|nr:hypothetical protein [candidate division Zixibacteria bacterium]